MINCCLKVFNSLLAKRISIRRYLSTPGSEYNSSLFISGQRAKENFVVVIPHLEFDKRFENYAELETNIKRRRLNYNLSEMRDSWRYLQEWYGMKLKVTDNLNTILNQINELEKKDDDSQNVTELNRLSKQKDILSDELQKVKKNVWDMEDKIIYKLLQLPNNLHPETPDNDEVIFSLQNEQFQFNCDHLIKGKELNCLEYYNEHTFYLTNEAALFELAVTEMFVRKFTDNHFVQFSNPDFARTVLAEGVCMDPIGSSELFLLENKEANTYLHLCGGASIFPFCGFHTKRSVPIKSLPVRYVASGRCYNPLISYFKGLYSVCQSTSVQTFIATSNDHEMYNELHSCIMILKDIFISLGLNFRIVKQPPHILKGWESLRISIQIYSPFEKQYIEVGHVSLIGDFISKKLRMCYLDKNEHFLKVVSGTVINSQALLALCLERSSRSLFIPDVMQSFMIS